MTRIVKEVIEFTRDTALTTRQSFYIEEGRTRLKPNRVLLVNGRPWFETNAYGLKGEDPIPGKRLMVVWGDSVVFGIARGWPELLNDTWTEWQVFNGGLEGDHVRNIIHRAVRMNRELAIDANVVFPGWHPSGTQHVPVNDELEETLRAGLPEIPNAILSTVPTVLRTELIESGRVIEAVAAAESPFGPFGLWGRLEPEPGSIRLLYDRLQERNEIVRRVAEGDGLPLVDWAAAMEEATGDDFREDFFDAGHPRPSAYPKIAAIWAEAMRACLPDIR